MASSTATTMVENWEAAAGSRHLLVGLLGRGIQLSRTPAMHEAEGRAQGLAYVYTLVDTETMGETAPALADIIAFAGHFGFTGFNVTFPYKQEIIPFLDELSEAAEVLGSVNTVVFRHGRRIGHNTDMWGFKESFRHGLAGAKRREVLLLGAGGAGAAVAHALLESGVEKLVVTDVQTDRAETLASRLRSSGAPNVEVTADLVAAAARADGIVNATPVGMAKLPGTPVPVDLLRSECWVADIVYLPLETELLREARKRGCRILDGEGMAVFQAAKAFELFTGLTPEIERMKAAFAAFGSKPAIEWDKRLG